MDSLKIAAESRFATITCAPKKVKRNSLLKNSSLAASELRCGLDTPLLQCFGRGYSASGPYLAYRLVRSRVFQQAGVFCELRVYGVLRTPFMITIGAPTTSKGSARANEPSVMRSGYLNGPLALGMLGA